MAGGFLQLTGPLSVADLLAIPNVGMTSLLELMCVAEAAGVASPVEPPAAPTAEAPTGPSEAREDTSQTPRPEPVSSVPKEVLESLEHLFHWAGTEGGIGTVAELLDATRESDGLPLDLARLWRRVGRSRIAARTGSDPLASVLDWYRSLDHRRQAILSSRTLVLSGARTLQDIAYDFGVSRERIRQVEGGLITHLDRLSRSKAWEPVRWRVHRVRRVAGLAFPSGDDRTEALLAPDQPCSRVEAGIVRSVILRLGGPYTLLDGWLIADVEKFHAARLRLLEESRESGSVPCETAREAMTAAGLRPRLFDSWLDHWSGMREIRDNVVEWPRTLGGRLLSLLRMRGSPASPDELLADLGRGVLMKSLRARLSASPDFVRVGRSTWGMRTWKLPEYPGIAAAITEELSTRGPSLQIDELASRLSAMWGVAENSVVSLCNAPRFVVDRRMVRLRSRDEPFAVSTDLSRAGGVFKHSDQAVSLLIDVDRELLRGSGRTVAEQLAGLLALVPGESREYRFGSGVVSLYWPDTSITGPAIGSLRIHAEDLNAVVGDRLRVTFRTDRASADVQLVARKRVATLNGDSLLTEVTGLLGHGPELRTRLAAAVETDPAELARFLRNRGDAELADNLSTPDA